MALRYFKKRPGATQSWAPPQSSMLGIWGTQQSWVPHILCISPPGGGPKTGYKPFKGLVNGRAISHTTNRQSSMQRIEDWLLQPHFLNMAEP